MTTATAPAASPAAFAVALARRLATDGTGLLDRVAAAEMARYDHARAALLARHPELGDVPRDHPLHELDEALQPLRSDAFEEGVVLGAAAEALRHALPGSGGAEG